MLPRPRSHSLLGGGEGGVGGRSSTAPRRPGTEALVFLPVLVALAQMNIFIHSSAWSFTSFLGDFATHPCPWRQGEGGEDVEGLLDIASGGLVLPGLTPRWERKAGRRVHMQASKPAPTISGSKTCYDETVGGSEERGHGTWRSGPIIDPESLTVVQRTFHSVTS